MAQQLADPSSLKANAEVFFQSYGMTLTTGINALLKQVGEQGDGPVDEPSEQLDTDFQLIYSADDILRDQADLEAGRIKTYSLAEIKGEANAIHG